MHHTPVKLAMVQMMRLLYPFPGGHFMELHLDDVLEMKKKHPCGGNTWKILRVGMDLKLKCLTCGHEIMVPRVKIEKNIRKVIGSQS
jgi:hypothetical protein